MFRRGRWLPSAKAWARRFFLRGMMLLVLLSLLLLAGLGARGLQLSRQQTLEDARAETGRALAAMREPAEAWLASLRDLTCTPALYPEVPQPAAENPAQELFARAQNAPPAEAEELYARVVREHPDALAASGVPLAPLAEWERMKLAPLEELAAQEAVAREVVENHPSVLTPSLLDAAEAWLRERGGNAEVFQPWRKRWAREEQARIALRRNAETLATADGPRWIEGAPKQLWLAARAPRGAWELVSEVALHMALVPIVQRMQPQLPRYAGLSVRLAGRALLRGDSGEEPLAQRTWGAGTFIATLADPARLYAAQRNQSRWLGWLWVSAQAAVLIAFWAMRRALREAERLSEAKSNFVASVSHELRAPVASMRLMAENLATGVVRDGERSAVYHRAMAEECARLSSLVDNVLDFARIEQGRKAYEFAETDVPALVRDAVQLVAPRAAQRGQTLRAEELENFDPPPLCDALAVRQALLNLLDNALKFSPAGATIEVSAKHRDAAHWELAVRDNGPGIAREEHARIFERFYRVGSELRRETQGAGIGLSIVQHVADGHGGRVELQSAPGEGAQFALVLPLAGVAAASSPPRLEATSLRL